MAGPRQSRAGWSRQVPLCTAGTCLKYDIMRWAQFILLNPEQGSRERRQTIPRDTTAAQESIGLPPAGVESCGGGEHAASAECGISGDAPCSLLQLLQLWWWSGAVGRRPASQVSELQVL